MKIIFLDIDGVLVNRRSLKERSGMQAVGDSVCVMYLNEIIEATGAKLVISSTWRFCGLEEMRLILAHWGVRGEVIGATPDLSHKTDLGVWICPPRGLEIQKWLDENPVEWESFVILDDDADMAHLQPHLVKTEFEKGLTKKDAYEAIAKLLTKNPLS